MIYGTTTMISVEHVATMLPIMQDQMSRDLAAKANADGYGLISTVRHSHTIELFTNEETGESYEACVLRSVADVVKLEALK